MLFYVNGITRQLEQRKVSDEENAQCLDDIFRNPQHGVEGLIESDSPAEFNTLHHVVVSGMDSSADILFPT